jgi:hypothetical protein
MAMAERKPFLLRIDSDLYTALARWADDELRSLNGQIEFLLHSILVEAGRLPTPSSSRALAPRPAIRKPAAIRALVQPLPSPGRQPREARREPVSPRALAPRPTARKPSSTRAQVQLPPTVSSQPPAPQPAVRKPEDESPPVRRPVDDWDAMVD